MKSKISCTFILLAVKIFKPPQVDQHNQSVKTCCQDEADLPFSCGHHKL